MPQTEKRIFSAMMFFPPAIFPLPRCQGSVLLGVASSLLSSDFFFFLNMFFFFFLPVLQRPFMLAPPLPDPVRLFRLSVPAIALFCVLRLFFLLGGPSSFRCIGTHFSSLLRFLGRLFALFFRLMIVYGPDPPVEREF